MGKTLAGVVLGLVALALLVWWSRSRVWRGWGTASSDDAVSSEGSEGGLSIDGEPPGGGGALLRPVEETSNRDCFLNWLVEVIVHFPGVDCAGVYLVGEQGEGYELAAHRGITEGYAKACRHMGVETETGKAAATGRLVMREFREIMNSGNQDMIVEGLRALAVAPVLSGNQVLGTLNIGTHRESAFSAETLAALETASRQMGPVLLRFRGWIA